MRPQSASSATAEAPEPIAVTENGRTEIALGQTKGKTAATIRGPSNMQVALSIVRSDENFALYRDLSSDRLRHCEERGNTQYHPGQSLTDNRFHRRV
jgi:hypothetical protein